MSSKKINMTLANRIPTGNEVWTNVRVMKTVVAAEMAAKIWSVLSGHLPEWRWRLNQATHLEFGLFVRVHIVEQKNIEIY